MIPDFSIAAKVITPAQIHINWLAVEESNFKYEKLNMNVNIGKKNVQ